MAAAAPKLRYALVEISHPLLPNIFEQSNLVYITSIVAKRLLTIKFGLYHVRSVVAK
jgi:hypothetical protein